MSGDRDNLLDKIEGLKTTVTEILDERDKLSAEGEELRTAKRETEEKAWATEEKLKEAISEIDELKTKSDEVSTSKDEAISEIEKERDQLRAEMDDITGKLARVSELYRETSAEKDKLKEKVDVSDLLAVYIMLIESVFYGKPHARILYTLHNTKKAITRRHIASSTGIQPMVVQKAIFDLVNAGLISYDENTQEALLIKEIM